MDKQLDITIKRARGYWFVDGFIEMAMGGLFLLLAAFLLFSMRMSQSPFLVWFLSAASKITLLKMVSFLIVILVIWWLKEHFTYPRTGFVRGKITANQLLVFVRNVIVFLLLPVAGFLILSIVATSAYAVLSLMPVWFPIGLAIIWAIFLTVAGEWMGLLRFRWISGMILLAGIGVGILQSVPGTLNLRSILFQSPVLQSISQTLISLDLVMLLTGLILIFSGILTFMRYRKENPEPYREDA